MYKEAKSLYDHYHKAIYDDKGKVRSYVKPALIGGTTALAGLGLYKNRRYLQEAMASWGKAEKQIMDEFTKDPKAWEEFRDAGVNKRQQAAYDAYVTNFNGGLDLSITPPPAAFKHAGMRPTKLINDAHNTYEIGSSAVKRTKSYKQGMLAGYQGLAFPKEYKYHPGYRAGYSAGLRQSKLQKKGSVRDTLFGNTERVISTTLLAAQVPISYLLWKKYHPEIKQNKSNLRGPASLYTPEELQMGEIAEWRKKASREGHYLQTLVKSKQVGRLRDYAYRVAGGGSGIASTLQFKPNHAILGTLFASDKPALSNLAESIKVNARDIRKSQMPRDILTKPVLQLSKAELKDRGRIGRVSRAKRRGASGLSDFVSQADSQKLDPNEWVSIESGGGHHFLQSFANKQHPGVDVGESMKGIWVHADQTPALLKERTPIYANRQGATYLDAPAKLTGKIQRKYLGSVDNAYEAGLPAHHIDKVKDLRIERIPQTSDFTRGSIPGIPAKSVDNIVTGQTDIRSMYRNNEIPRETPIAKKASTRLDRASIDTVRNYEPELLLTRNFHTNPKEPGEFAKGTYEILGRSHPNNSKELSIINSTGLLYVDESRRSRGFGQGRKMYGRMAHEAKKQGFTHMSSDYTGRVSDAAVHVWKSLQRRGYPVTETAGKYIMDLTKLVSKKASTNKIDVQPTDVVAPALGAVAGWLPGRFMHTSSPVRAAMTLGGLGIGALVGGSLHQSRKRTKPIINKQLYKKITANDPLITRVLSVGPLRKLDLENEALARGLPAMKAKYLNTTAKHNATPEMQMYYQLHPVTESQKGAK